MPDIFSAAISGDASQAASLLSEDPKLAHAGIAAPLNGKGAGPGGASRAGPGPSAS